MKILIYGAGAMGTYMAFRLAEGGHRVSLAAQEESLRFQVLQQKGVRARDVLSGAEETAEVSVFGSGSADLAAEAKAAELLLVSVAAHQLQGTLEVLREDKPVMILGAHYMDREKFKTGPGPTAFLYGFPGSSAAIDEDGVVNYLERGDSAEDRWGLTIGTWKKMDKSGNHDNPVNQDDQHDPDNPVLFSFRKIFESSGLPVRINGDMRSVVRSQNSVRLPLLAALQLAGGKLNRLSERGDLLKLMVLGTREALVILRKQGSLPIPASLDMYRIVPVFITANMIKRRFSTPASLLGIEDFGNASIDETAYLTGQLLDIAEETGAGHDHLLYLFSAFPDEA